MAAFGEQIRNAIIQPFSISITYHYPFTFSVELHSISYFIEWSINALLYHTLIFLLVKSITTAFFCP